MDHSNITPEMDEGKAAVPTAYDLAAMPLHLQRFALRHWKHATPPPGQEEIEAAERVVIRREYEIIRAKVANRFIYFAQVESGPIKIGVSGNPKSRIANLQVGSAERITLLLAVPGGATAEANLHAKFFMHRLHGEWFAPHPDILDEIERLKSGSQIVSGITENRNGPARGRFSHTRRAA